MDVPVTGLLEESEAKDFARKIFSHYAKKYVDELTKEEVVRLMSDGGLDRNMEFYPVKHKEIYYKVYDKDGDGRVTLRDMERMAIKYLVGIPR